MLADVPLLAVRQMERWVGLHEVPRGSDRVPELVTLAGRLGVPGSLGGMGYPWCAFAVFLAALAHGGAAAARGLRRSEFNAVYTPAILAAAKAGACSLRVVPAALAFRGDLVLFDWDLLHGDPVDHVGRLVDRPVEGACGRWTATPAATVSLPAETVKVALFGHLFGIRDDPPRIGGR